MIRTAVVTFILVAATISSGAMPAHQSDEHHTTFAYVGSDYIITAEVAGDRRFILNVINLTDYVIVILPGEFIYRGASGRFYNGQVYEKGHIDLRGNKRKYTASLLLKEGSYAGLTILGAFRELDRIEELSIRIGSGRFYLSPLDPSAFEQLAAKIGELDLRSIDPEAMLKNSNIEKMGTLRRNDGSVDWDSDWAGLVTADGINPPKIIERPGIMPTREAIRARVFGTVRITANINKDGGIYNMKVARRLGYGLDERAMEGVLNSWVFLPATKTGEVLETAITIDVEFSPPEGL
ncbi:MAG TPA: TonB family protein [Acidobacteriota bacterium]|nr:TonB family protein [Acidobacteriota bacterium]